MANVVRVTGPTARRVATNVAAVRRARGLDLSHLSDRLAVLGQPISVAGLSRVELGQRRVDVDDLAALALALDVSPARLLMPAGASAREEVGLTPKASDSARGAWGWATGDEAPRDRWRDSVDPPAQVERLRRWADENQPFSLNLTNFLFSDLQRHQPVLDAVVDAVDAAEAEGASRAMIWAYDSMKRHHQRRTSDPDRQD